MIVRTLTEVVGTEDDVSAPGWNSRRLLLARHGMGFSMHDTIIEAGAELPMHYKHHLEAVYCIEGEGEIESRETGERWPIQHGTIYALDQHDAHVLRAKTRMRMICTFNPPVTGQEVHGADGAYAAPDAAAE
ncbi:MAG: ectoine synthase [Myxococcales bacterium]|nr:ectoine synthase [Myxococcales bacterium]